MYKFIFLIAGYLLAVLPLHAQDSLLKKLTPGDSLIREVLVPYARYNSIAYSSNGFLLNKQELKQKLASYSPSALEFNKYKSSNGSTLFFCGIMMASSGIASNQIRNHCSGAGMWVGVAGTALVATIISVIKRNRHWDRSIELYNQQFH